jgi:arylsulfatase A-like enzyme
MDTARQDRLSVYGYFRDTTPNLTKLAKSSRVYYNAYSTSGWTIPAHASLFTGLYPVVHKATQEKWSLDKGFTTLAEILLERGYETTGIIGNAMIRKELGFDQGFKKYYALWKEPYKSSSKTEHRAYSIFKETLKATGEGKPFFIFINLMEPHSPYDSSRQFYNQFVSDQSIKLESNMWRSYFTGKQSFSEKEIRHLNELYDAEILYVDYLIGKMISYLKKEGIWKDTIFIVTSDHGENIGDHEMMDHVFSLYESTIKIPLIIHYPRLFAASSKDYITVQLTDIFPTILNILGIDTDKYPSQGIDLLTKEIEKERYAFSEYYYPKQAIKALKEKKENPLLERFKRRIRSIISDKIKLIWGSDGKHELYDLAEDPNENDNIIDSIEYTDLKSEMFDKLRNITTKYNQTVISYPDSQIETEEILDDDTLKELKSLGYVQ